MFTTIAIALSIAQTSTPVSKEETIKLRDEAEQAWVRCVMLTADTYAQLSEPADTIAQAALSKCSGEQSAVERSWYRYNVATNSTLTVQDVENGLDVYRTRLREHAVTRVLDARLKKTALP